MKESLRAKLDSLAARLQDINGLLAAENATRDMEQFKKLSREHAELSGLVALYDRFRQSERDAAAARDMAADPAMRSFAEEELRDARSAITKLCKKQSRSSGISKHRNPRMRRKFNPFFVFNFSSRNNARL